MTRNATLPLNSRNKGAAGERELAEVLRANGFNDARRGVQFKGGPDSPDVVGFHPDWHPEVKRVEERSAGTIYEWQSLDQRLAPTLLPPSYQVGGKP